MPIPAIVVEALGKYFPSAHSGWRALLQPFARLSYCALTDVSFEVESGTAAALVGPNGAGKSTLLRILATLIIPTHGCARMGGFDVERDAWRARQQCGYHTSGDEGFYGRLTARENLTFFAAMNNLVGAHARDRIQRVSETMGISEELPRQVRTLSTGMTHRLGLARALLHGPSILLLDEPTRSLDPIAASAFRRLLKEDLVRSHGATLLFASHSLAEVEQIADRVVVLDQGRVVALDTPKELPRSTGSATLEAAIAKLVRHTAQQEMEV